MPVPKIPLEKRFWEKVDRTDTCWLWRGGFFSDGYGVIRINRVNRRAHRVAYELTFGPIKDGLWVLRRCDTPACVRPDHLWLGTHRDNMDDCARKGRTKMMGSRGDANGLRKHPERNPSHLNPDLVRGENNGNAKITHQKANEIRERYAAGGISAKKIASEYSISTSQVYNIVHGRAWTHKPKDCGECDTENERIRQEAYALNTLPETDDHRRIMEMGRRIIQQIIAERYAR